MRYLILTGNAEMLRQHTPRTGGDWNTILDQPQVLASYVPNGHAFGAPITLSHNRGVIFGSLFARPSRIEGAVSEPTRILSEMQCEAILASRGRSLSSDYWGYYVAVLHYPGAANTVIFRSPASPLPCFHARLGTCSIFFSHLDDFTQMDATPLSINWDSIACQVAGRDYLSRETAFNEIESVECGETIECGTHVTRQVYWDPRTFLANKSDSRFQDAALALRRNVDYCVGAHASSHKRVTVALSGGLDSSIVLASLARAAHKPVVTAVNYWSRGSGDERQYARSIADISGCKLVERARNEFLDLRRLEKCNRTVRPVLNFSAPDVEIRNIDLARSLGATAIFNGELGDNVFGSNPDPGVILECLRQNGPRLTTLQASMDFSMLNRYSIWKSLNMVYQCSRYAKHHPDFNVAKDILGPESSATRPSILASSEVERHCDRIGERFLHDWLKQARPIAPGSHTLLYALVAITSTSFHSPFSSPVDPPKVYPLLSQPLVELVLQMPSHLHCRSGVDRAVARYAFRDALPSNVLNRGTGKGGPTLWAKDVVAKNASYIREYLLGGMLAERRLIDTRRVEAALSQAIVKSTVTVGDIIAKLYIESWLRQRHSSSSPTFPSQLNPVGENYN